MNGTRALIRPEIQALEGYSSARMEAQGGDVLLNANESPWPGSGDANWNRYPDPQPRALVERLALLYGVAAERVLVTRGSDEGIDLLTRTFCAAGRGAIIENPPCFGMYRVSAAIQGCEVIQVPLAADWSLDRRGIAAAWRPGAHLVYVCSPNNPTGNATDPNTVAELAEAMAGRAVVVVDEAYQEFSAKPSCIGLVDRFDNLVVLRTLSKAYGLAGIRCGGLVARAAVIATLRRVMAPYPIPAPSVAAALDALDESRGETQRRRVAGIVASRASLAGALTQCAGVREVWALDANFVLARVDDASAWVARCADAGVLIRDVSRYPSLEDCVRITVGSPPENSRLLEVVGAPPAAAVSA